MSETSQHHRPLAFVLKTLLLLVNVVYKPIQGSSFVRYVIVRVELTFNILSAHKLNDETVTCRLLSTMICYLHLYDGTRCNESDVPHTVQVTKPQSFHFLKIGPKVLSTCTKRVSPM